MPEPGVNQQMRNTPMWIMETGVSWAAKAHYLAVLAVFERALYRRQHEGQEALDEELRTIPDPQAPGIMALLEELESVGAVRRSGTGHQGAPVFEFVTAAEASGTP